MYGVAINTRNALNQPLVKAEETGVGVERRTVIRFSKAQYDLADEAGVVGKIVNKIYDFPEGLILFKGAVVDLTLTKVAVDGDGAGLSDTFDGDVGLGSVVGAGATLATTEQDYVATTSIPQAVGGVAQAAAVSAAVSGATGGPRLIDGTAAAPDMYLNILVDDADQDATGHPVKIQFDGTVSFEWELLGDK